MRLAEGATSSHDVAMVSAEEVKGVASSLPRAYEAIVRDRVKFRVGRIVFLSFTPDETMIGFGYPKQERDELVAREPEKFLPPLAQDIRYHWVRARLDPLGPEEMHGLIADAWRMTVPKKIWAPYYDEHPQLRDRLSG